MSAPATTRQKRLFLFDWDNTLFPSFVYEEQPHGLWVGAVGKKQPYRSCNESIALYSELHDVSHLNAVGMFVGQPIRAMLSLKSPQPGSPAACEARRRVAAGCWKLLDAARQAGGEIYIVTAGTSGWLAESFDLCNRAVTEHAQEDAGRSSSSTGSSGGAAGSAAASPYTLVLPDALPVAGDGHGSPSASIQGYSTVHLQLGKEDVFQKLAVADGATELVVIGDGAEEMAAARAIQEKGVYTVTTIDLQDRRPPDLDAFMASPPVFRCALKYPYFYR